METVFWLMWLADIAGNIGVVGWIFAILFALFWLMVGVMLANDVEAEDSKKMFAHTRWLLLPLVVAMFFPSQGTIRLLAATKAAGVAADTQLGKKGLDAANAVLDRIIGEAQKPAK